MKNQNFYNNLERELTNWGHHSSNSTGLNKIISPYKITLPKDVYNKAQQCIESLFNLKNQEDYQNRVLNLTDYKTQPHHSILMAYDFHYSNHELKLIEVNTNASGFLLSHIAYKAHELDSNNSLQRLKNSIEEEYQLFYEKKPQDLNLVIIDEQPTSQKMYIEFLLYKKLFEDRGWKCHIQDFKESIEKYEFVYNRYCDFDFSEPASKHLKQAYIERTICFSPHPTEYLLLAHKDRFMDWTSEDSKLPSSVQHMIPKTQLVESYTDKEQLWTERKNLFFKPRFLYGGKAVYNGKSISRTLFEKIYTDNSFMIQQTCPPGKLQFNEQEWKFDLRFYVYKDSIQQVIARIYQGQLTNFNTPNGGFCPVLFD